MSYTPRIFLNQKLEGEIEIKDEQFHYLINVLRMQINSDVILINGKDGEFLSKIILIKNKYLLLKIEKRTKIFQQKTFLGLIFSPIQKIDLLLKNAVELGVTNLFPVKTDFTSKLNIKENKMIGNIIEAVEQSERTDFPTLNKINSLAETLKNFNETDLIFFCQERSLVKLSISIFKDISIKNKKIYALVGPEGGFSKEEKDIINNYKNIISISLGDNILRTENATSSILSILNFYFYWNK